MTNEYPDIFPASTDEVVNLVREAAKQQIRLCVRSSRHRETQREPAGQTVQNVVLDQMNQVIDYPARDMTITVQAGLPFSELQSILAAENQQLPVDTTKPEATIGEMVASDVAGPRRYGYGTLRDYVIGIEGVDGQGRVFHAGGRVVKNVAGYDLCRMMVGSRGALGVLTQVTFKLKPLPACQTLHSFQFRTANEMDLALERLNTSNATPVIIDFDFAPTPSGNVNAATANEYRSLKLHIGVEGTKESCEWQAEQLRLECGDGAEIASEDTQAAARQHCRSFMNGRTEPMIQCLPSCVVSVAQALADHSFASAGHAGNGILFPVLSSPNEEIREVCDAIAEKHDGVVSEWRRDHPANSTDQLTSRLRRTFDPASVFTWC